MQYRKKILAWLVLPLVAISFAGAEIIDDNTKPSPAVGPWAVEHDGESPVITFEARNIAVVESYYGDGDDNAALIVKAVNAHDALVAALKDCADFMGSVAGTERVSDSFKAALRTARAILDTVDNV